MAELTNSTIYIIGGLPRTGKTLLSERLSRSVGLNILETDHLRSLFNADRQSAIGYDSQSDISLCTKTLRPYLEALVSGLVSSSTSMVINGEAIHPKMVARSPYVNQLQACFLGIADPNAAYERIRERDDSRDWAARLSDDRLHAVLGEYAMRSQKLERTCNKLGVTYIDTSEDILNSQDTAYYQLTQAVTVDSSALAS